MLIPTVDLIHRLVYFIHYFVSTNFPGLEGTDERLCVRSLTQVPSLQQILLELVGFIQQNEVATYTGLLHTILSACT